MFDKINNLEINGSGIDTDGDPFVILENGTIFYGSKLTALKSKTHNYLYQALRPQTKQVLQYECTQVALDIMIRYVEGGLQYGGPKKQSRYNLKAGDFAAEMGAYQGFCSLKLAQQVGSAGSVVAIEPMPDNFRLLQKNKEANKLEQLVVVNKGVWDSPKELVFNRRIGDGQSSSIELSYDNAERQTIQAETLDRIFEKVNVQATDFMIIQLNGAEINALRGLDSFKPKNLSIAARYDTEGEDAALAIKRILEERGYMVTIAQEDFVFAKLPNERNLAV